MIRMPILLLALILALTAAWPAPVTAQNAEVLAKSAAVGREAFMRADYQAARAILEPLAEAGDAEAQYWVGVMYAQGRGFPPICRQATRWYEKAARQGHREAAFNLGFMLYNGYGIAPDECMLPADHMAAAPWLQRAAELGVPRAIYLVGHMYAIGDGLPLNRDAAFDWLQKAADLGIPEGQAELAVMYAEAGNRGDAYTLYFLLSMQGYPGAQANLDALASQMEGWEVHEAERRAYYWHPAEAAE